MVTNWGFDLKAEFVGDNGRFLKYGSGETYEGTCTFL